MRFAPADGTATAGNPVDATFIWAIDDLSGLYVARVDFDRPGRWTARITLDAGGTVPATAEVSFDVVAERPGVGIGMPAPRLDNPTAADVGGDLDRLTTDVNPMPGLYEHSVGQLLDAGRPFVLIFASPGFCTSGTCGPTLERVKTAARANPGLAFVQVEPYAEDFVEGRLQPILDTQNGLQPSDAFKRYDMPTETSVLLVDRDGVVRDVFDVLVGSGEVEAALPEIR